MDGCWSFLFFYFLFFIFYRWHLWSVDHFFFCMYVDTAVLVGGASNGGTWIPCINEMGLIGCSACDCTSTYMYICHTVHDVSLGDNE